MNRGMPAAPPFMGHTMTPMIAPELTHASQPVSPRQRRYKAPNDGPSNAMERPIHQNSYQLVHSQHYQEQQQQQQIGAPVRFLVPPTQQSVPVRTCDYNHPNDINSHSQASPYNHVQPKQQQKEQQHKEEGRQTYIRMILPSSISEQGKNRELHSWRDLPVNPLIGLPGLAAVSAPVEREDYSFYCDSCQKGFFTKERYDIHMKDHIWCTFPGCEYTCRRDKEWKMELHVETLHNRPDAPNLADVGAYLSQRKNRFPTENTVKAKVEELFYKASRGVELPDERRRWLRQHGVLVRKNPRTERTYIVSNALQHIEEIGINKPSERHEVEEQEEQKYKNKELSAPRNNSNNNNNNNNNAEETPTIQEETSSTNAQRPSPHQGRQRRIIPLGPNGTLTRGQKVQLIREKYREASTVPSFHVCHRCGEKGTHWVSECPKKGNEAFERQMVWGEERREPLRQRRRTENDAEETSFDTMNYEMRVLQDDSVVQQSNNNNSDNNNTNSNSNNSNNNNNFSDNEGIKVDGGLEHTINLCRDVSNEWPSRDSAGFEEEGPLEIIEDGGPPAEVSARLHDGRGELQHRTEITRVLAPVAAAKLKGRRNKQTLARKTHSRAPPPPTLYERLTEAERADEHGLLLQAFRFFVKVNFFESA